MPTSNLAVDLERNRSVVQPLDGYPSLAETISSDPDRTSLVFKRFNKLAVRNLLYLQSELVELEAMQVHKERVQATRNDVLILLLVRKNWTAKIGATRIMTWLPEDVL